MSPEPRLLRMQGIDQQCSACVAKNVPRWSTPNFFLPESVVRRDRPGDFEKGLFSYLRLRDVPWVPGSV